MIRVIRGNSFRLAVVRHGRYSSSLLFRHGDFYAAVRPWDCKLAACLRGLILSRSHRHRRSPSVWCGRDSSSNLLSGRGAQFASKLTVPAFAVDRVVARRGLPTVLGASNWANSDFRVYHGDR